MSKNENRHVSLVQFLDKLLHCGIVYNATGDETPVIFLTRRNSEEAVEFAKIDMSDDIKDRFMEENGNLKGVFAIEGKVKDWIYKQLNNM